MQIGVPGISTSYDRRDGHGQRRWASPLPYRHNEAVFHVWVAAACFGCKARKIQVVKTGADAKIRGVSDGRAETSRRERDHRDCRESACN